MLKRRELASALMMMGSSGKLQYTLIISLVIILNHLPVNNFLT